MAEEQWYSGLVGARLVEEMNLDRVKTVDIDSRFEIW